jgi:hypothetical protein
MIQKFRKKPVVIEAVQLTHTNVDEVNQFIGHVCDRHFILGTEANLEYERYNGLYIITMEGKMLASIGDWIIKGVKGEFYPCKPDIFEQTYEKAD